VNVETKCNSPCRERPLVWCARSNVEILNQTKELWIGSFNFCNPASMGNNCPFFHDTPMRRTLSACCARAASGPAAAPASKAINLRRLMCLPLTRSWHRTGSNRQTGSGQGVARECPLWVKSRHRVNYWITSSARVLLTYQSSARFTSCIGTPALTARLTMSFVPPPPGNATTRSGLPSSSIR
jgi:hypothetical protein